MKQIPIDGSYFLGKCDGQGCHRPSNMMVRQLNLDHREDGANIFLCPADWQTEMNHRLWSNNQGVAEQWDIFDFYEENPALEVEETPSWFSDLQEAADNLPSAKKHVDEPMQSYSMRLARPDAKYVDIYIASANASKAGVVGSSVIYRVGVPEDSLLTYVQEAREHARTIGRTHALVALFEPSSDMEIKEQRHNMLTEIIEFIAGNEWKDVIKYGT